MASSRRRLDGGFSFPIRADELDEIGIDDPTGAPISDETLEAIQERSWASTADLHAFQSMLHNDEANFIDIH